MAIAREEVWNRILELQWWNLVEEYGLTGEHIDLFLGERALELDLIGVGLSARGLSAAECAEALKAMPAHCHQCLELSATVATKHLQQLSAARITCLRAAGKHEAVLDSFNGLDQLVIGRLEKSWKGHSADIDRWFAEDCTRHLHLVLTRELRRLRMAAREVECRRLESQMSDVPSEQTAGPPPGASSSRLSDPRDAIDAFIAQAADAGRRITRRDIWTAAGYRDATEFERFQRGDARTNRRARDAFRRVLAMEAAQFFGLLDRKNGRN